MISCSGSDSIVVIDSYFAITNNITEEDDCIIIDPLKFHYEDYEGYSNVVITSMIYSLTKDSILNKDRITILGSSTIDDNIKTINFDYSKAVIELLEIIVENNRYQSPTIFIDEDIYNRSSISETITKNSFNSLIVNRDITKSDISKFISKIDSDIIIILTKRYGYTIYNQLRDVDVAIISGGELRNIDDHIKYSIEFDYSENMQVLSNRQTESIEFKLKKY